MCSCTEVLVGSKSIPLAVASSRVHTEVFVGSKRIPLVLAGFKPLCRMTTIDIVESISKSALPSSKCYSSFLCILLFTGDPAIARNNQL